MNEQKENFSLLIPMLCGLLVSFLTLLSVISESRSNTVPAVAAIAASPTEPAISAEAYGVWIAGDERPLIGRRTDKPLAPASLTKIMTSAVAAEKLAPGDTAVISAYAKGVEERKSAAEQGKVFSRNALLQMALVMSANDAALALAERVGGDGGWLSSPERVAAFVRLMNAKARILGLDATHFENPTGLDMPRHVASAHDLATLAGYVLLRHPELWEMTRAPAAQGTATDGTSNIFENSNDLLKEFPGLRGGKTGRTDRAKDALLLLYPAAPDKTAIIVILRSDDRFGDGRKLIRWIEEKF